MDAGRTQAGLPSWFRAAPRRPPWPACCSACSPSAPGWAAAFCSATTWWRCHGSRSPRPCSAGAARCPARCRATPVAAAAARVLPADIVQKLFLLAIFVLARGRAGHPAGRPALAGPARQGRGLLRVEPVRRRAAHHRPVGAAARLRRAALGAGRGDPARGHLGGAGPGGWGGRPYCPRRLAGSPPCAFPALVALPAAACAPGLSDVRREAAIGGGGLRGRSPRGSKQGVAPAQHGALRRLH